MPHKQHDTVVDYADLCCWTLAQHQSLLGSLHYPFIVTRHWPAMLRMPLMKLPCIHSNSTRA